MGMRPPFEWRERTNPSQPCKELARRPQPCSSSPFMGIGHVVIRQRRAICYLSELRLAPHCTGRCTDRGETVPALNRFQTKEAETKNAHQPHFTNRDRNHREIKQLMQGRAFSAYLWMVFYHHHPKCMFRKNKVLKNQFFAEQKDFYFCC